MCCGVCIVCCVCRVELEAVLLRVLCDVRVVCVGVMLWYRVVCVLGCVCG